jgi:hypothetical protein
MIEQKKVFSIKVPTPHGEIFFSHECQTEEEFIQKVKIQTSEALMYLNMHYPEIKGKK